MSIFLETTDFEGKKSLPQEWEVGTFKYCNFSKLDDGRRFTDNRWYACTQSGCTGFVDAVPRLQ